MTETLGFIGLGNMGEPIASNLLKAGYNLRIYNRTAAKAASLVEKGATLVASPADVAQPGGIVLTMVADDRAVEEICYRQPSFVDDLGPNGVHISVSTIAPDTARRLAQHHRTYSVDYVASPVFGRPEAAAAKRLWVCSSGPAEARKRVRPVLEAIGQGVFEFGEDVGAANVVKLCGNFLVASAIEALAESLTLAEKNGLNQKDLADFVGKTLFSCPVYQSYGQQIAEKRFEPTGFRLTLGLKDINLALDEAASSATPMPLASLIRDHFLAEVAKGRGKKDWAALALGIAENAGLK